MRTLTDKPFGVNIAQAFVRDPEIAQFVIEQGVKFVSTSAGNPERYTDQLKSAGLTVFHVVPSLKAAEKAVADAGCTWADIDAVILGKAPDLFEGVMMPELFLNDAVGGALLIEAILQ